MAKCIHDWLVLDQIDNEHVKLKCFKCNEKAVFIKSVVTYVEGRSELPPHTQDTFINLYR